MRLLVLLIIAACAMAIPSCGGGNSGYRPPPPVARGPLDYGYFETSDGQLAVTMGSVTFLHLQDDSAYGDPAARQWRENQMIARLQEAQALGPRRAMLSIGYLIFDAKYQYVGIADLDAFEDTLGSLGLLPLVQWLYIVDEPDVHGIPDATMLQAEKDVRADWPSTKLAVVYGTRGPTPGITGLDLVGRDDYSAGTGVFNELPPIRPDQSYIILPGGANPWRQDPQPFLDYANVTPQVAMIWAFLYGTYSDANGVEQGIGTNGMLASYQAVGCKVTEKC